MQSTNLEEIKVALWEQAYHQCTRVRYGVAHVMAVRKSKKGYLQVVLRRWAAGIPWKASPLNTLGSVQRAHVTLRARDE